MEAKFSPRVKDVITYSREEAMRLGHEYIGLEHLMLGIIRDGDGLGIKLLKKNNINLQELRKQIEHAMPVSTKKMSNLSNIPLLKQAEKALKLTYLEAKTFKANEIGTEHLLLCILKDNDNIASKAMAKFGMDYDSLRSSLEEYIKDPSDDIRMEGPTSDDDDADDANFGAASQSKKIKNTGT
jgi:ATP-dependent Clp protease ATP-binding subunit ClpC